MAVTTVDIDPVETKEWLDALTAVIKTDGIERARFILNKLISTAGNKVLNLKTLNSPYCNTLATTEEAVFPGDQAMEHRIRGLIRWNAVAMVVRAVRQDASLGGHIGTFASTATLYDVGFNHFWRGGNELHGGDCIYFQGHASPGIYARAFLEGRISAEQLSNFRQEIGGCGLSSYPHPWLMPKFWQFPTVSMGLGPLQAIYQARFIKYMQARNLANNIDKVEHHLERKVWCFCGDGEMDEPESTASLNMAVREKLDNLIFVINCNLQRLDGPVRGNGKVIQELEATFLGAGWNVIKVIWGQPWDNLLAQDKSGLLQQRMEEAIDGDYQNYAAHGGAYTREHFFGKYPELRELVAKLTDKEIFGLYRGGHDVQKVYAAYHAAVRHEGKPTVILAKTIKGYGLGTAGEGLNTAHNTKKMAEDELRIFRERFNIPVSDQEIKDVDFYRPAEDAPEIKYLQARRAALGGENIPSRRVKASEDLATPPLSIFEALLKSSGDREISTTMALVRILTALCRDKNLGNRVVPIIPDEARTFGMEGLFRQLGIYSPQGQLYTPVDVEQVMFYKEACDGQILEEGLNEAGAFCSWLAAATAYSVHNKIMIPFYIFYSMFGFQRIGDLAWAAGDSRARGFLMGATAGRTTLNGEGLQHEDGTSQIAASNIPNCIAYDPTFSYELAVIIHHGLERMVAKQEDVFFYITIMNENYQHPEMPAHVDAAEIIKGLYLFKAAENMPAQVKLLGCGTILNEVIAAQVLLKQDFNITAEVWSATSLNELTRDGMNINRWNRLHPDQPAKQAYVTQCLGKTTAPVVAATDYHRHFADQIREYLPVDYLVLGTDGFGRSDSREKLRRFFEVDRYHVVVGALTILAKQGLVTIETIKIAIARYNIDADAVMPMWH